ncbi:zinc finger protein ZFP2 [Plutella xylostella]|uniref:zinc finger protein ZFP2 n=1 Tax=Plutella xylostella TaxID=51655 RepID=UPI0020324944|nr:zinc finger protein ZFP2 [Plutella xylostella]
MDSTNERDRLACLKKILSNVLHKNRYCCLCFGSENNLSSMEENLFITNWEGSGVISLESILESVFGDEKVMSMLPTRLLCDSCRDNAVNSYIFVNNTRHSVELLDKYLKELSEKVASVENNINDTTNFDATYIVLNDTSRKKNSLSKINEKDEETGTKNIGEISNFHPKKLKVVKLYTCHYCDKKFIAKPGLSYHINKVHTKYYARKHNAVKQKGVKRYIRKYECPDCVSTDCEHKKYLNAYKVQRLAGEKLIKCPDCDYSCYLKTYLIAHANKIHLKTFNFKCEVCSKPLHSKMAYKIHKKNYHSNYESCQYCERKFMFTKNLKQHMETCKEVVRDYKCDVCLVSMESNEKLAAHKKKHIKEYPCNLCNKVLSTPGMLRIHKQMHQSNQRMKTKYNYSCHVCNKSFSALKEREEHIRTHGADETAQCIKCNIEFVNVRDYMKHLQSALHKGALPLRTRFECNYCNYNSSTEFSLEAHINRYHLKIAPYPCDECSKSFTNKLKLYGHKKTHEKTKTYKCDVCENYFCGPTSLKKHMRLHTGERPYACEFCSEKFVSVGVKNLHIQRKHNSKSISCPLCDRMFNTLTEMRSHFKRMHWKFKGEEFDVRKVEGLSEEHYDLFRDRRMLTLN